MSSKQLNVPSAVGGIAGNNKERLHSVHLLENSTLPSHRIPQLVNIVISVKCMTRNYPPGSCVGEWWPPWGGCTTSAWASGWWWRAGRSAAAKRPSWPWRPTPPSLMASCALLPGYPPPSPAWRTWPRPSLAVRHFSLFWVSGPTFSSEHICSCRRVLPVCRVCALSSARAGVQEGPGLSEEHHPRDCQQSQVRRPLAAGLSQHNKQAMLDAIFSLFFFH